MKELWKKTYLDAVRVQAALGEGISNSMFRAEDGLREKCGEGATNWVGEVLLDIRGEIEAAFEQGAKEFRSTWQKGWTRAASDYDGGATVRTGKQACVDGYVWWEVEIHPRDAEWQIGRYHSGLCGFLLENPEETARVVTERAERLRLEDEERARKKDELVSWVKTAPLGLVSLRLDHWDEEEEDRKETEALRGLAAREGKWLDRIVAREAWRTRMEEEQRTENERLALLMAATLPQCLLVQRGGNRVVSGAVEVYFGIELGWVGGREASEIEMRHARSDRQVLTLEEAYSWAQKAGEGAASGKKGVRIEYVSEYGGNVVVYFVACRKDELPPLEVLRRFEFRLNEIVHLAGAAVGSDTDVWVEKNLWGEPKVVGANGKVVRSLKVKKAAVEKMSTPAVSTVQTVWEELCSRCLSKKAPMKGE